MIGTNDRIAGGQQIRWSPTQDTTRSYLTDGLTPAGLANYLKQIDEGDIASLCELQEEMEGKDAHLQSVCGRRRESLTALDWSIVPDRDNDRPGPAKEAAEFCARTLSKIPTWPETLEHLATAIGPGVAVTELIWETGALGYRLVGTNDVPGHRLVQPLLSSDIHIITDDNPFEGLPTPRGKFVVYTPNSRAGFPFRVVPTRAQGHLFLIRHLALSDWASFCELFGMPIPIAQVSDEASTGEREKVRELLRDRRSPAWGMFTDAVTFQMLEASKTSDPYTAIIDWLERKTSILWLGQTLTTEMQSVGSFAAAKVHENVRASILLGDIQNECRTIRDQVLWPITEMRFPGQSAPIPHWERRLIESANIEEERLKMDKLRMASDLGLTLDNDTKYELLGLPEPAE